MESIVSAVEFVEVGCCESAFMELVLKLDQHKFGVTVHRWIVKGKWLSEKGHEKERTRYLMKPGIDLLSVLGLECHGFWATMLGGY